jgi:hypothetical protein
MGDYDAFIRSRQQLGEFSGFDPLWMPDFLFPFQRALVDWSLRKGRAAIFADCGLGKTAMQLVWAENVLRKTGKPSLILTPLAVAQQTVAEAEKFGIGAAMSRDGSVAEGITVTNYEKLHLFDPSRFGGVVCDESSILKDATGVTRKAVTEFLRLHEYRLLCTATAAPNDFNELGTSSEALGELGHRDMLTTFFKLQDQEGGIAWGRTKFRLKGHARQAFWRWVCSWARAVRKPADMGFADDGYELPALTVNEHVVDRRRPREDLLFTMPAVTLEEQREERRATIAERCERVAEMVSKRSVAVVWCQLNAEGDLLERLIPDAIQVSGADDDDSKESKLVAFSEGRAPVLVIKPKIGSLGLNWQHCDYMTTFPSHSYEQYYQAVRRCWRFGQKRPVTVEVVRTEGEGRVMQNMQRKAVLAEEMFAELVANMNDGLVVSKSDVFDVVEEVPSWL